MVLTYKYVDETLVYKGEIKIKVIEQEVCDGDNAGGTVYYVDQMNSIEQYF